MLIVSRRGKHQGADRPADWPSDARRHVRAELAVRQALVRTRTRCIALAKALVGRNGLRVAASEAHLAAQRIGALELSAALRAELAPLFTVVEPPACPMRLLPSTVG